MPRVQKEPVQMEQETVGHWIQLQSQSTLGKKRWKLKRSWTFQGLKRDTSVVGIHKPKDKDSSDVKDENAPEAEQGTDDVKVASDIETQEKTNAEGEDEKEANCHYTACKIGGPASKWDMDLFQKTSYFPNQRGQLTLVV